jgi:hypothetical protein
MAEPLRRAFILTLNDDRAGARELVSEFGHRSLDFIEGSGGHHAQGHLPIWPANLDASLLKEGSQNQGVPEGGALNLPRHVHYSDAPSFREAPSGIVAVMACGPVNLPQVARMPTFARSWLGRCPCPMMSTRPAHRQALLFRCEGW